MATLVEGKAFACVSAGCFLQVIWPGRYVMHWTALVRHRGHFIGVLIVVLIGREFKVGLSRRSCSCYYCNSLSCPDSSDTTLGHNFCSVLNLLECTLFGRIVYYSSIQISSQIIVTPLLCYFVIYSHFFFTYFSLLSTEEQPISFWFCPR